MAKQTHSSTASQTVKTINGVFTSVYPWQITAWNKLSNRIDTLPHALLLGAKSGVGKRKFATSLISRLLCDNNSSLADHVGGCQQCSSCCVLLSGNHPRLLSISLEVDNKGKTAKQLKIDQIRAITPFVQQTSNGLRVISIDPADTLNLAAANALLKNLEEPAANVVFILISDKPLSLLPTIRSRLQILDSGLPNLAEGRLFIEQKTKLSVQQATIVLKLTNCAPLQAVQLAEEPHFIARQAWINDWVKLINKQLHPYDFSIIWIKKLTIEQVFALMQWMLRDILAVQTGQPPLQTDLQLIVIANNLNTGMLLALEQYIYQLSNSVSQNIQPSLMLSDLSHKMAGLGW